jgi:hypothetical protein
MSNQEQKIKDVGQEVIDLLVEKNRAYGNSALNPANIFAKGSAVENLCSRIDDKLMRIKNKGIVIDTEDTIKDLIGYLILLKIALNESTREKDYIIPDDLPEGGTDNKNNWVCTHSYTKREEQIYY